MFSKEIKLDFKKKKVCPKFGRIQIERQKDVSIINFSKIVKTETKSFDEKFKDFGMASLYSTKQIINGLDSVKK